MTTSSPHRRRRASWVALFGAVAAALALSACTGGAVAGTGSTGSTAGAASPSVSGTPQSPSASVPATSPATTSGPPPKVVRVASLQSDGVTYGIGMPVVLFLTPAPTDSSAFTKAATVTVNGQAVDGAWFWEQPTLDEKQAGTVEAHFRTQKYWPANSAVHVDLPIGGLSAGNGLVYSDKLTSLDFKIGDAHISRVDGDPSSLQMVVTSNGKVMNTFGVSLGKASTPTFSGVKVVMQKGEDVPGTNTLRPRGTVMMNGPGYSNDPVPWSVRITRSGEYVHAAGWNTNIGTRSTSNGCTNLKPADGEWFYNFSLIGDVVTYTNTTGGKMPSWDGFGDWNVPWAQWKQGGLLVNH